MNHGVKKVKLGRTADHRRAMLKNLSTSILRKGMEANQADRSVVTTVDKAKAVRSMVERLITYAKKGDLSSRRQAAKFVDDHEVLQGLFAVLGPRYAGRQGGYTRVLKLQAHRRGDAGQLAMIQLVEDEVAVKAKKPAKKAAPKAAKAPKAAAPAAEEPKAEEAKAE